MAAVISPPLPTAVGVVRFPPTARPNPVRLESNNTPLSTAQLSERLATLQSDMARRLLDLAEQFLVEASRLTPPLSLPVEIQGLTLHSFPRGLQAPLEGLLSFEDDEYVVEVPKLGVIAASASREGVIDSLSDQVDALATHFLSLDDSRLTPGGIAMRETLRALVAG